MKEFLPDNIGLLRKLEAFNQTNLTGLSGLPAGARLNQQEVNSLLTWVNCFTMYVAILGEAHPELVRSRLAYMSLIISEAIRSGGDGWKSYDSIFRQNAAEDPELDWSKLDTSLHSSTFLAQRAEHGSFCSICFGTDHNNRECAMRSFSTGTPSLQSQELSKQKARYSANVVPICIRWNKGACIRKDCRFRHTCATCPGSHRAAECPLTQPGSMYKRGGPIPANVMQVKLQ